MSPDSVEQAARLGARLAIFSQLPWDVWAATSLAAYQRVWGENHSTPPPPPLTSDLMYCAPTDEEAEAVARVHMAEYYLSVLDHYELLAGHFGVRMARARLRVLSSPGARSGPDVPPGAELGSAGDHRKLAQRRELVGDFEPSLIVRYAPCRSIA
jgi:hypothetical protein